MPSIDWFRDARWGVFTHYLADAYSTDGEPRLSADDWNRRVDSFDTARLAAQLQEAGAGYYFLTLGQNSGHYCSPNAAYDDLVGRRPSLCSRRDLVADVADALAPTGIKLLVYHTSHPASKDHRALVGTHFTPPWDPAYSESGGDMGGIRPSDYAGAPISDERMTVFQQNWEAVTREWSERWGRRVCGWWVDGCYQPDRMYRHPDAPNFASFAAAMRAGNPDALVAFNPGVKTPVISMTDDEDYTAGELDYAFPVSGLWYDGTRLPSPEKTRGRQYHLLSFLGQGWGAEPPRFSDEFVIGYTRDVNALGGVVTWDVPIREDGLIPKPFIDQLVALKGATRK